MSDVRWRCGGAVSCSARQDFFVRAHVLECPGSERPRPGNGAGAVHERDVAVRRGAAIGYARGRKRSATGYARRRKRSAIGYARGRKRSATILCLRNSSKKARRFFLAACAACVTLPSCAISRRSM